MPVFNAEKYLSYAIESILLQTFKDFEFIIVDDCSTDNSWKIIKDYARQDSRILPLRNSENLRTTKTLNRGLRVTKGKYMVRMDADDWSYPDRLQKQFDFMENRLNVGVSGGTIEICDERLKVLNLRRYPQTDENVRKIIFRYSPFAHPATIWRMKIIKEIGGYNENIPLTQDYELYFRVGQKSKFSNLSDVILKLRTHNDSSSLALGKSQEQFALYSRIKAFLEYGYTMTIFDKAYTFLQMLSLVIIPQKVKFWLFNFIRRQL